jgi:outer membrane protein OmpA-like peptidoglycan-associated protein
MLRTLSAIVAIAFVVAGCGENVNNMSLQTPPPAPPGPTKEWMVFFDTNSTALSQQANSTVSEAATVAKSMPSAKVMVTGFTDTDGSPGYNKALSVRRATAVKTALERVGVAPQSIVTSGDGEQGLLVPTADQVKNPNNRRVRIVVQ